MIEAIAIGLGAIWLGYKWVIKKQFKYIILPVMLILLQLSRWPFFLNISLVAGMIGIIGAIMMGIEFFVKKRIVSVYPYIIILLFLGCLMLIDPLHHYIIGKK